MEKLKNSLICFTVVLLVACGGTNKQEANAQGFGAIENILKSRFGDGANYTDLTITYNETIGNIVGVTVTDAPESLKMGQWTYSLGNWNQTSEITLEIPEGTKAADFMFQLGDMVNLGQLGELVEKSKEQLTTEKGIENPSLHMAFIKMPKNGNREKMEYVVMLKPENGGTTFTFSYGLNGVLTHLN